MLFSDNNRPANDSKRNSTFIRVTRSFDDFFDLCLNKRLRKQSWGWWFEMLSRPLWCHCNDNDISMPNIKQRITNLQVQYGGNMHAQWREHVRFQNGEWQHQNEMGECCEHGKYLYGNALNHCNDNSSSGYDAKAKHFCNKFTICCIFIFYLQHVCIYHEYTYAILITESLVYGFICIDLHEGNWHFDGSSTTTIWLHFSMQN